LPARRAFNPWIVLAVLAGLAALGWYLFLYAPAGPVAPERIVPVSAARASLQDVPVTLTALGAAQAWTSVTVFSQVSGKLLSVNFAEGARIRAGDVLAQVDPAPFRAALMQAQGALQRDEALLENAKRDLDRYQKLLKHNAISRQVEETQAGLVKQDEGTVLIDQGQVAAANVNLGWCRITSPITGRAGVRLVDPGNLVSASGSVSNAPATAAATSAASPTSNSASGIVVINQLQPMAVTFTVPEGVFQRIARLSDGFRKPLPARAYSQESGTLLDTGKLSIADNRVAPATGTVELKARFPNAREALWPGQFVNVELQLEIIPHAITIPVAAVNEGPNGSFVYVIGRDSKVSVRPVTVSLDQGDLAVIAFGLRPGETVVTDGQMILKPGATVRVVQPESAKPHP
jgi:multidrug efflux system membrane fusion protein